MASSRKRYRVGKLYGVIVPLLRKMINVRADWTIS